MRKDEKILFAHVRELLKNISLFTFLAMIFLSPLFLVFAVLYIVAKLLWVILIILDWIIVKTLVFIAFLIRKIIRSRVKGSVKKGWQEDEVARSRS